MNNHKRLLIHMPDPFDASARARLINMGLINARGEIDTDIMPVFAGIFSGLFLDDICDFYDDTKDLETIRRTFEELYLKEDYHNMYLFLSIQYDYIRKPLPDPVWWLAGDSAVIKAFMRHFMERLAGFTIQDRHIDAFGKEG